MRKILSAFNAVIAIAAGGLVLLGYFFPTLFGGVRQFLLQWAVLLAAFALLLGLGNLFAVHWKKLSTRQPGAVYSAVLLFFMALTFIVVLLEAFIGENWPATGWSQWLFQTVRLPVEKSLLAVLTVVLALAAARLIGRRNNTFTLIFLAAALLTLLLIAPVYVLENTMIFEPIRRAISSVLALAGARGLLLGIGLGTVAAALRVLMGVDRPYGG